MGSGEDTWEEGLHGCLEPTHMVYEAKSLLPL